MISTPRPRINCCPACKKSRFLTDPIRDETRGPCGKPEWEPGEIWTRDHQGAQAGSPFQLSFPFKVSCIARIQPLKPPLATVIYVSFRDGPTVRNNLLGLCKGQNEENWCDPMNQLHSGKQRGKSVTRADQRIQA